MGLEVYLLSACLTNISAETWGLSDWSRSVPFRPLPPTPNHVGGQLAK